MKTRIAIPQFRYMIVTLALYFGQSLIAQNLVVNPSFEDLLQCPKDYGSFENDVLFWTCPTDGSTDYFNTCSAQMDITENFAGTQKPYDGEAYAGFYAYGPKDYREYIGGEIKETLQKGKKYIISARVSLSDNSGYSVNELGFLFRSKALDLKITRNIPYQLIAQNGLSEYVGIIRPKFYNNKNSWIEIKKEYTANGTERYFTFGNFKDNRKTQLHLTDKDLKKASYYFVDAISIKQANESFNLKEIYVLEGLNYDVDGFQIKDESLAKLKGLVAFLKENPSLIVTVNGHTDNAGTNQYNKELSTKRAKSVGLFLVENGLSPFRIAWKGYGAAKPIMANKTEKGRQKNRRVEFVISKRSKQFYASGVFEDDDE